MGEVARPKEVPRTAASRERTQFQSSGDAQLEAVGWGPGPLRPLSVVSLSRLTHPTIPAHLPVPEHLPLSLGLVTSDKESAAHILSRKEGGNLLAIIVGGAQEALNARPGAFTLLLRNRKGFVRLALMHGYLGRGLLAPGEICKG